MVPSKRPQWAHLQTWVLLVVLVVLSAISAVTLAAAQQANHNAFHAKALVASIARQRELDADRSLKVDARLQAAIDAARRADYRLCLRQMTVRIVVNVDNAPRKPKLKLYDCTPNLRGQPARLFTLAQAAAFARRFTSLP